MTYVVALQLVQGEEKALQDTLLFLHLYLMPKIQST